MKVLKKVWHVVNKYFLENTTVGYIIALGLILLGILHILVPTVKPTWGFWIWAPIVTIWFIGDYTKDIINGKGK